jgi:hypothetical protein
MTLAALGAVKISSRDALDAYVSQKYLGFHGVIQHLDRAQLDDCARAFGRWIRSTKAKKAAAA